MRKKCCLALFAIAIPGTVYLLAPPVSSFINAMFMLFQQNSAQVLLGRLSTADHPALTALLLSAFQAAFLPWKEPLTATAVQASLGSVAAAVLTLTGTLLASILWYGLIRGLVGGKRHLAANTAWVGALAQAGLSLLLGGWAAPLAGLSGTVSLGLFRAMAGAAVAALPGLVLRLCLCGLLRNSLPLWGDRLLVALGLSVLLAASVLLLWRKRCSSARQR